MKAIYVRELTEEETKKLKQGLRSASAFTVKRSQILLTSTKRIKAQQIAEQQHCSHEMVRKAIHAFNRDGLACLQEKSHRPHSAQFSFSDEGLKRLPDIVATSPRAFGVEHSLWSLQRLAQVCYQEGLTERVVSHETMSEALRRAGINWQRARKRLQSPDPAYEVKKNGESA